MESPIALNKKCRCIGFARAVETGINASMFSSANRGVPQATFPTSGTRMVRACVSLSRRSWTRRNRPSLFLSIRCTCISFSTITAADRGERYPNSLWMSLTDGDFRCIMEFLIKRRALDSLAESFSFRIHTSVCPCMPAVKPMTVLLFDRTNRC